MDTFDQKTPVPEKPETPEAEGRSVELNYKRPLAPEEPRDYPTLGYE